MRPRWVTSWAGSAHGPYPIGNPSAQPDLRFAFPSAAIGAREQTFRLNVRPGFFASQTRMRFTNVFGTRPVTLDGVFVGLQQSGSVIVPGSNQPVAFGGQRKVTIPPGAFVWSDAVSLPFSGPSLIGRRLAVSFHVVGESGPMTWHAKALTTSYLTAPDADSKGDADGVLDFPFSTTSWYFLDAIDMEAEDGAWAIVAFGDSITDGTASTLNGDDRWPDVLLQRLHARGAMQVAVVNAGIGGNCVVTPEIYRPDRATPGGPRALDRLARDVIGLSGVRAVIWLEGINDLGASGNSDAQAVIAGMRDGVARMRAAIADVRIIGATLTSALHSSGAAHGSAAQDAQRALLNDFIRHGDAFDDVADFDRATCDPATGALRAEFVPDSTMGGPGDGLHPNRAAYAAMAACINLASLLDDGGRE